MEKKSCRICGKPGGDHLVNCKDYVPPMFQAEEEPEDSVTCSRCNLPLGICCCKFPTLGSDLSQTLKERGAKYGPFKDMALITQNLKNVMQGSPGWGGLTADKREALDMIVHKIARILNGDPEYLDSWHDIIGYAKLIENDLLEKQK